MFLMNAPPVVTLQSRWEAFSPPGSFRFPGCFSESKEDVARASVSAKVQMIISTLQQHNEVPLGMSAERPAQRSQKAERCLNTRPATSPSTCREQPPAFAACGLAARSDPPGEGEAAGFGPLVLDSDSDDSVDRDIEEAIQEYLKARSGGTQPGSGGAPPDRVSAGGGRCKLELPHSSTPPALGPPKLAPVSGSVSGSSVGAGEDQGSASPVSVSSEDSFEQSIRVEIEQFLHEKRQHENPKCDAFMDKRPDPNEDIARATLKSNKEPPIKAAPRQDLRGTLKEFVFRKPPRVAKMSLQPRSLRPKVSPEPETVGSMRLAVPKPEAAQSKGGVQRSTGAGRRGWQVRSPALVHEASDSSSDDGIEEAIQLYQLEKTRKETSGDALPRTQLREEVLPGPPASGTSSAMKSALSEAHRRAPSRKKPVALKAADPGPGVLDPDPSFKLVKDAKASAPPVNTSTRAESAERVSCRADSSTELMCAEAILDISKTILPAPVEDSNGPPSASPHLCSPDVPSRSDGDSSSVDSDDSIEQEIRTFLALKAQSESVLASAESCPQPTQGLLLLPGPSSQASDPKAPPSNKTPEPSLSCKRKRRGGSNPTRPSIPKKTREVRESTQDGDRSQGRAQPGQNVRDPPSQREAGEVPGKGEARAQPVSPRTVGLSDAVLSQGPRATGKAEEGQSVDEKGSSEDKSSSLDSDEDLDTAIRDLLRSKRKLKKKSRDPRAACKKKVRFSTTETRFLDRLGGLPGHWKDRGPRVLRSCLSKSSWNSRAGPGRRPPGVLGSSAEIIKPASLGDEDAALAFLQRRAPEGTLSSREMGARDSACPARSPSSLSEDSSVDSDDSIELEIRKFLAEKAKESVSISEIQGVAPTELRTGAPARPEVLCRKEVLPALHHGMCTRSQRAREAPQPAEGAGVQGTASLFVPGRKGAPHDEHAPGGPAALGRCEPALPKSTSRTVSTKASPTSRRNLYAHKDQSPRGAEPAAAESVFSQLPSCARASADAGSARGSFHVNRGSQSLLTPSPGPQVDLSLPWSDLAHQSRLPSPWALNSDTRGSAWTGPLGAERERAAEPQARGPPGLSSDPRKGPAFPGFSSLLSTQLFHFGKSVPWGGTQPGLFSAPLGLPLQGPSFSAFRETPAGHSPVFGSPHLLTKKGGSHWPSRKAQARLGLQNRKNSGSEENILDLRYQRRVIDRDNEDQEALGSDTSVEDGGGTSVVKGRGLTL
ncbi:protein phosphatase 1 regulatory subunit 26 [Heterocephalus glaber]|uniref:Protein phosphatase 1 regulatory subunit 26 n=1 Tax=Heterocephalus glaber TaxID=10181 RepID=A0A0P6JH07_HETGA|nr:protein phosphatase 1 regulatory subunit 26 [Heterocephalus glaber]XP_012929216.1 protein phosphatase 1 regulatory subunit 26 [Heterocephalus glaber]XP_012929217.1 protein phosphatase 1 regulatory subunit 26 [Heterocephalus glaber]XP_021117445.1 protein phosphatase 1 regulatory subunit 26 [Heterocephalus glaber]XP_021117446.1 protein phosphatase 1 regulatory subunit 26 [Heterocephalus glaber]XP_021117447.1 protein phosphatase 1 regulatory subunit 26 [Heterocephalus glaber]